MEREGISLSGKTQYAFGGAVLSEKKHLPAAAHCPAKVSEAARSPCGMTAVVFHGING
jgi:hypothetical protein